MENGDLSNCVEVRKNKGRVNNIILAKFKFIFTNRFKDTKKKVFLQQQQVSRKGNIFGYTG